MRELLSRLFWTLLALLHRVGLFGPLNWVANRYVRAERAPFLRRRRVRNVQILVYHRVTREPDSYLPPMPLSTFERQMEILSRRFRVIGLDEAIDAIESGSVPDNAVVVTFDDGYRDNFDVAWPVLAALSMPATVYLTTGVIGTDAMLWHDRVFHLFHETAATRLAGFGSDGETLPLTGDENKERSLYGTLPYFRSLPPEEREEAIGRLAKRLGVEDAAPRTRLMLSWDEVKQMHRGGVSFGAHTVSHTILSRLPVDRARWEIIESKREIERRIGAPVTTFAYPNGRAGDFDTSTKVVLREAGFDGAVTTIFGANPGPRSEWDPFEIRRGGPDSFEPALFAAKMNLLKLAG